jgi:hypothetical protein
VRGQEVVFLANHGLQRAGAVLLGAGGDAFDAGGCGLPDDLLEAVGEVPELVGGVVAVEPGEPFGVGGEERRERGDVAGVGGAAEVAFLADEQRPAREGVDGLPAQGQDGGGGGVGRGWVGTSGRCWRGCR